MNPCAHGLGPARCPSWPWCGCDDDHQPAKPLPDPEQLTFDDLEDDA